MTGAVEVVNHTRAAIDEEAVAALVEAVLEAEGAGGAEVGVTFVGERRMRALNREYRGKDEVTDVLSFPLEDVGESGQRAPEGREGRAGGAAGPAAGDAPPRLLGDVVVCARQALRQARAAALPPGVELAVLLVHGTLHLLGYDHETDVGAMALRQAQLLETVDWEALVGAAH
ncbi:MAG TPA: rRNA maturation RNase YbeY [Thermoleophilia bacterium]|nr:rRNA maturation RNase YbeY [Thermoleophilia bacterium]